MLDEELVGEIQKIVRETIQEEVRKFKEAEIVPLRRQVDELLRKSEQEHFELPPALVRGPQSPFLSSQRSNTSLRSTTASPSLLQRVGSKVASTTSTLLHGGVDGDSRETSPLLTSLSLGVDPTNHPYSGATSAAASSNNSVSSASSDGGPVTVRRNSGVTRATDNDTSFNDLRIPLSLQEGLPFLRITHNKKVQRVLRIDKEAGVVSWNTKQSSRLFIDRIAEIYVGEEARNYREEFRISVEHSQRWATIIHQRPNETKMRALHLIIANQNDFDLFISSLFKLVKYRREIMSGLALAGRHFVDVHWNMNSASSQRLSYSQVLALARQLHVHCSRHYIKAIFDEADLDKSRYLDFAEFQEFVRLLKRRQDIKDIYDHYKIGESVANLINFFTEVQHEPLPRSIQLPIKESPSVDEFGQLLASSLDTHSGVASQDFNAIDLTYPLNCYFISSSHNTYLMGRQVADGSSIESCIRALQDGCRCIELDCWDGPNSSASPVVYHGHSLTRLTTSVIFSDVVEAVLKYAFISTPFPLILSLEIRCNESSQLRIVSILRTILAGLLVTEPLPGDDGTKLPSPDDLKHKILVKVKGSAAMDTSSSEESNHELNGSSAQRQVVHSINPALAELGVYFGGRKYPGTVTMAEPRNAVYSFNERTFRNVAKDTYRGQLLEQYNVHHFSRVYPGPYRLTSSNFDPIYFWKRGVQMVALNWQTFDLGMQLNTAFFSNRVGYVLKPPRLRPQKQSAESGSSAYDNVVTDQTAKMSGLTDEASDKVLEKYCELRITIISAQQLPRPKFLKETSPFSPQVTLEAFGIGSQESSSLPLQWKTAAVFDNGFNPNWNYSCAIEIPPEDFDFACLRFTVAVEGQPFAYHLCRVATMQPGYRHLSLVDLHGEEFIFSSLFMKSEIASV